jgi:hypothetical protein
VFPACISQPCFSLAPALFHLHLHLHLILFTHLATRLSFALLSSAQPPQFTL